MGAVAAQDESARGSAIKRGQGKNSTSYDWISNMDRHRKRSGSLVTHSGWSLCVPSQQAGPCCPRTKRFLGALQPLFYSPLPTPVLPVPAQPRAACMPRSPKWEVLASTVAERLEAMDALKDAHATALQHCTLCTMSKALWSQAEEHPHLLDCEFVFSPGARSIKLHKWYSTLTLYSSPTIAFRLLS